MTYETEDILDHVTGNIFCFFETGMCHRRRTRIEVMPPLLPFVKKNDI
jgi:hypothetical protein